MDIVVQIRAQMLSALFSALDQPLSGLLKPGEKAEARVLKSGDQQGQVTVAIKGQPVVLALNPQIRNGPDPSRARASPSPTPGDPAPSQAVTARSASADVLAQIRPGQVLTAELDAAGGGVLLRLSGGSLPGEASLRPSSPLHPVARTIVAPTAEMVEAAQTLGAVSLKQQSLGKVFETIAGAVTEHPREAAELPLVARQLVNRVMDLQIDGDLPVLPEKLRQLMMLMTGQQMSTAGQEPVTAQGLKALFQMLKAELAGKLPEQANPAPSDRDGKASSTGRMETAEPRVSQRPQDQQPPTRLPAVSEELARTLHHAAEAGEARTGLTHAIARSDALLDQPRTDLRPVLALEIPIAMRGEVAVADFRLDQEHGGGASAESKIWQARFSVELPDAGTVHARAGLRGETVAATIWAEDNDTAQSMREAVEELKAALAEQGLDVLDLRVLHGRPAYKTGSYAGQLLQSVA